MAMPGSTQKHIVLVAVVAATVTYSQVMAGDITYRGTQFPSQSTTSTVPLVGGVFSITPRTVNFVEALVGGPFRLHGMLQLKAESDVFSDGFEVGDTSRWSNTVPEVEFPIEAVVAFALEECPAGWVDAGGGRALVGLAPGGSLNKATGSGWTGTHDYHYHYPDINVTTDWRSHNHHWGTLVNASFKTWQSYTLTEDNVNMVRWENGLGKEGSGYYLLTAPPGANLYTQNTSHNHPLTVDNVISGGDLEPAPNVQLRFCRKE